MLSLRPERRAKVFACKFFIIFVDGIFTVLSDAPFTNVFDANAQKLRIACVCRARNAD
jgi:hypothetical protein